MRTTVPKSAEDPGDVVGYVPGAWDMFHIGHLNILLRAREQCDRLVVGVVSDDELTRVKGRPPIIPLSERVEVVSEFGIVDEVVVDYATDKREVWARVGFDVLFKGDDWRGTTKGARLEQQLAEVGAALRYFPYTAHTSSTRLRALLELR